MPDLPEPIANTRTPDQIVRTLEIFRNQYQHGLMTAKEFQETLGSFQFRDDAGYLWSPGANTGQWYRWDGRQWTPAAPPPRLNLPPALATSVWEQMPQPAPQRSPQAQPRPQVCARCGQAVPEGGQFCPYCGQPTAAPAASLAPPPSPSAATPRERRCPNPRCGQPVAAGKQFCTACGTRM